MAALSLPDTGHRAQVRVYMTTDRVVHGCRHMPSASDWLH